MPQLDLFEPFSSPSVDPGRSSRVDHGAPAPFVYLPLHAPERFPGLRAPLDLGRLSGIALALALTSLTLLATGLIWYYWQSTRTPTWWASAGVLPDDSIRRAEAVERGITAALYAPHTQAAPRTVELKAVDANSWLSDRMPKWLANQGDAWPEGLSAPRIAFDHGRISLGVRVLEAQDTLAGRRIISLAFTPALESAGSLRLVGADARIGRARLGGFAADLAAMAGAKLDPRDTPIQSLLEEAGGAVLGEILLGHRPAMDPALIDLDDGRRIRILDVQVLEDSIRVTYVTEWDAGADQRASAD